MSSDGTRVARTAVGAIAVAVLATSCGSGTAADSGQLPNPAAVRCEELGGRSTIVTDEDGSQRGLCGWPDGSSCDEWELYRGECQPPRSD